MGLIKNVEQPTGVVVSYWEMAVMEINVNFRKTLIPDCGDLLMTTPIPLNCDIEDKSVNVYLFGYLDKAARVAGKFPISSDMVTLSLPENVNTIEDLRPLFYQLIMETEKWSDAVED